MQRLLRRSVLLLGLLLIGATGLGDAAPPANEQPGVTVVSLLDPMAMPESAIPVARVATISRAATTIPFPYVPQSEYLPTQTNYWEGRGGASINYIVIHYTDISYARTLRAFNNLESDVSAHTSSAATAISRRSSMRLTPPGTPATTGTTWSRSGSSSSSTASNPIFTAEEYYAAAALVCAIGARQGIPLDRAHVIGHNEVPGSTHTDPGPTWDWPHFMGLTSLCAPPTSATVHASFVSETPYPEIGTNDAALVSVILRNTGSTAWRKGTAQEARLGIPGNSQDLAFLADGWPTPERPAAQQEDIVPPGATATFSFRVKGTLPGTFVVPLRGVVDGGAWMDDLGMFTVVTVR